MGAGPLILGLLSIIAFVILEAKYGLKSGLFGAIFLAALEVGLSLYIIGHLDVVSYAAIAFFIIVLLAAIISYLKKESIYFRLHPTALFLTAAGIFLYTYYTDQALIRVFMIKYKDFYPPEVKQLLNGAMFIAITEIGTMTIGYAFIIYALLMTWVTYKLNNWWWVATKFMGNFIPVGLGWFLAVFLVSAGFYDVSV